MTRHRHDVQMSLGGGSVATDAATGTAIAARATTLRADWVSRLSLGLCVGAGGEVRARMVLPSKFHAQPHLLGRLSAGSDNGGSDNGGGPTTFA